MELENRNIESNISILESNGYQVKGSGEYYQIYLKKRKKGRGYPLVTTISNGQIKEVDPIGSSKRRFRTYIHTRKIKKLLKLENI